MSEGCKVFVEMAFDVGLIFCQVVAQDVLQARTVGVQHGAEGDVEHLAGVELVEEIRQLVVGQRR